MEKTETVPRTVSSANPIPKPELRSVGSKLVRRNFFISAVLSVGCTLAFKHYWVDRRRQKIKEYYENYDEIKDFEAIRKAGVYNGFVPN